MAERPEPLPIDALLPRIVASVRESRNLVIVAPPGAGKTTRVPSALLDAGCAGSGEIVVLQPRRIAARMAARRVASERGGRVGGEIGYQVRFDRAVSAATRIRFVTEGVLTRRLLRDPSLAGVAVVVLDEVHERHLDGDLALALLLRLQGTTRPDLILVAMSATLHAAPVAAFLGDCPVVTSEGRGYPVAVEFLDYPDDRPVERQVASAVHRLVRDSDDDGHVLVFLPGAAEIRRAAQACAEVARKHGITVCRLHGDLPAAEQDRAVAPSPRRKLILATNVAESSLTIDGVSAVIDAGTARIARHSPWSGARTLRLEPISRASAIQRAGRAGRTRAGRCVRLYTRHDFEARRAHQVPELLRADLAEVVLAARTMGVRDLSELRWLDAPPEASVRAANELLLRLGAVDAAGAVTPVGQRMTRFPLHPRHARLVIEAERRGVAREACVAVACIGQRPLRVARREAVTSGPSDVLEDVDAFAIATARSRKLDDRSARAAGLEPAVARAVDRVRRQLERLVDTRTPTPGSHDLVDSALRIAILAGYPDRVAKRRRPRAAEVRFADGGAGALASSSVVIDAPLMVAVDAEERGRGAARRITVRRASAIEPDWLMDLCIDRMDETDELVWDAGAKRVAKVSRIMYGEVALDETREPARAGDDSRIESLLADAACAAGLATFADPKALAQLTARLAFLAQACPDLGTGPPTDAALDAHLRAMCAGLSSFAELRVLDVLGVLRASLRPVKGASIERMAPTHVALPGRRRVPVHYEADRSPWIESRLQDFFGLDAGPRIASGRVPLVLHLLAPNRRAVQVSSDLAGFWERHYPALRRQLMRRYPRHAWPEDPMSASAQSQRRP